MHFNDPFDQRQAYTSPLTFGIQLVEQAEDFFMVARVNTFAVVADKKYPLFTF